MPTSTDCDLKAALSFFSSCGMPHKDRERRKLNDKPQEEFHIALYKRGL